MYPDEPVFGEQSEFRIARHKSLCESSVLVWTRDDGPVGERRIFWSHSPSGESGDLRRLPCGNFGETWEHVRYLVECEMNQHGRMAYENPWRHASDYRSDAVAKGFLVQEGTWDEVGSWSATSLSELRGTDVLAPGSHVVVKMIQKPRQWPTVVPGRFRHDVFAKWHTFFEAQHASRWKDVVLDFAEQDPSLVSKEVIDTLQSEDLHHKAEMAKSLAQHACLRPARLLSEPPKLPHFCDRTDEVPQNYVCHSCQRVGVHLEEDCDCNLNKKEEQAPAEEEPPKKEPPERVVEDVDEIDLSDLLGGADLFAGD